METHTTLCENMEQKFFQIILALNSLCYRHKEIVVHNLLKLGEACYLLGFQHPPTSSWRHIFDQLYLNLCYSLTASVNPMWEPHKEHILMLFIVLFVRIIYKNTEIPNNLTLQYSGQKLIM